MRKLARVLPVVLCFFVNFEIVLLPKHAPGAFADFLYMWRRG